jgi:hypothetical protein
MMANRSGHTILAQHLIRRGWERWCVRIVGTVLQGSRAGNRVDSVAATCAPWYKNGHGR